MRLITAVAVFAAFSTPVHAEIEFIPTPDNGSGPIFTMWRVDTTGQQRTQLCEFYRAAYTYQTGLDDEIAVTVERHGALETRFRRCLSARFKE